MTAFVLKKRFKSSCGETAYDAFGDGLDVVLVHGTPVSSVIWHGVVKRLQHKYRFHLLDLPGYGSSKKFEGQQVQLRSFARVLAEWLADSDLADPILVGHDFGGATVMGAHLEEHARVKAICVSDGVILSPWGTPFSRHVKEHEETFADVPEYIHRAVLEAHLRTAVTHQLTQSVLDRLIAPWLGKEGQRAYYRQVGQYDYEYTQKLEKLYPSVTIPTVVFWGEEDRWVDISEGKRFSQLLPDASLRTLPDAGHFVMLDAPGLFARYLDEWLSAL